MSTVEPIRKKSDLRKVERILAEQSMRDLLLFTIGTNCGIIEQTLQEFDFFELIGVCFKYILIFLVGIC